jgi:hypothetical protein
MPRASVRMTIVASPLVRPSVWKATLKSRRKDTVQPPQFVSIASLVPMLSVPSYVTYDGVMSPVCSFSACRCREFGHLLCPTEGSVIPFRFWLDYGFRGVIDDKPLFVEAMLAQLLYRNLVELRPSHGQPEVETDGRVGATMILSVSG